QITLHVSTMPLAGPKVLDPRISRFGTTRPTQKERSQPAVFPLVEGSLRMSENQNKSPAGEYWTKAIDTVTDTWNYFLDRSKILVTSGTITSVQDALKNS